MRPTSLVVAVLAVGLGGAAATPPAAAQDPFGAGKTVEELIELCKRRIAERESDVATTARWEDFRDERRRVYQARLRDVVRVWKQDAPARFPLQPILALGRLYRSYGDTKDAGSQFAAALRKAQDPMTKRLCHLEFARLYALMEDDKRARAALVKAGSAVKQVSIDAEVRRLAEIGQKIRDYRDLLERRAASPRDWRAQFAVCEHLRNFRDPEGLPYLIIETLVAYDWLRVAFPNSPAADKGGANWFTFEVAAVAKDMETAIEAADRLWPLGAKNAHVVNGELVLNMATLLRQDDLRRQQAVRCYRWMVEHLPNHAAVAGGQIAKAIQELERQKGVRREPIGTPLPDPPWAP